MVYMALKNGEVQGKVGLLHGQLFAGSYIAFVMFSSLNYKLLSGLEWIFSRLKKIVFSGFKVLVTERKSGEELRTEVTSLHKVAFHSHCTPPVPLSGTDCFLQRVRVRQQIVRLNSRITWRRTG